MTGLVSEAEAVFGGNLVKFGAKWQSGARSLDRGSGSGQRHLRALRDLRR